MSGNDKTILMLFGLAPSESALLAAGVLAAALGRQGCRVQWAGAGRAVPVLRSRVGQAAIAVRPGVSWLGGLGRSRLAFEPAGVVAWDLEAACLGKALGLESRIVCHSQEAGRRLEQAGASSEAVMVLAPAIDASLLGAVASRRGEIRERLGLASAESPVFAVPRLVGGDSGHFRAAWAVLLLQKGGLPARLLLAGPNREAARCGRFAVSCREPGVIVVAPAGTGWLEVVAAADGLVVPGPGLYDPVAVAWAMAAERPVVSAGVADSLLLDAGTHVASRDGEPLNLARAMMRVWQDRSLAASITLAGQERVRQVCDPAAVARACLAACRGAVCQGNGGV